MFLLRRSAFAIKLPAYNARLSQTVRPSLLAGKPAPSLVLPFATRRWLASDVKDHAESHAEPEVDEETLDPENLASIEAEMAGVQDDDADSDWFVDKDYEQDHPEYHQTDFVPLWQRRATGDTSLSTAAEEMIKEKTVKLSSVLALLEENKAENIGVIDMRSKCDWTDYMIVAESSRGERFLNSIAEEVVSVVCIVHRLPLSLFSSIF